VIAFKLAKPKIQQKSEEANFHLTSLQKHFLNSPVHWLQNEGRIIKIGCNSVEKKTSFKNISSFENGPQKLDLNIENL